MLVLIWDARYMIRIRDAGYRIVENHFKIQLSDILYPVSIYDIFNINFMSSPSNCKCFLQLCKSNRNNTKVVTSFYNLFNLSNMNIKIILLALSATVLGSCSTTYQKRAKAPMMLCPGGGCRRRCYPWEKGQKKNLTNKITGTGKYKWLFMTGAGVILMMITITGMTPIVMHTVMDITIIPIIVIIRFI